jgi:addiction module RelE/StbE family toxin
MRVRWSERSARDLETIHDYIAHDKPEAARITVENLILAGDSLALHPNIGRPGRCKNTRELVQPPFVIVYGIEGDVIDIRAVLHGSRR